MLFSSVRRFTDPDRYAAAIRQATVELTITGRGHFEASLVRIDLHRLWMQRLSENRSRIRHVEGAGKRAVFTFPTNGQADLSFNGIDLLSTNMVRHREGGKYFQRSSTPASFGGMSLGIEDIESIGHEIAGCNLNPPRDAMVIAPSKHAMTRLQRLHASAGHLAETASEVLANPEAARGLEAVLIEALVACLDTSVSKVEKAAQGRHDLIMRRFHRAIEERPDQPLYMPEICRTIRVPLRTLSLCCHDHLGMSPKQYLIARRLHLARRELSKAESKSVTVTTVAFQFGFWQLGHFAKAYRELFDELPSVTLSRGRSEICR